MPETYHTHADSALTAVAAAIRTKLGNQNTYKVSEMPAAIISIPTGGADARVKAMIEGADTLDLSDQTDITIIPGYMFYRGSGNGISQGPSFRRIVLPSTITTIWSYAFQNQKTLEEVVMPATLAEISTYVFNNCIALALTALPTGLTSLGYSAFRGCTALALTSLPTGINTIGNNTFQDCAALALTSLPTGLTSIGTSAFSGCTALALTALPTGLTSIGNNAFEDCASLALTALPECQIGKEAFKGSSLAITELPAGITFATTATNNFENTAITEIDIKCTLPQTGAFTGCLNLTKAKMRGTKLSSNTFSGCTALDKVWISADCTSITASSQTSTPFTGCTALTDIYCEAASKPSGWGTYWYYKGSNQRATVHWGVSEADFDALWT